MPNNQPPVNNTGNLSAGCPNGGGECSSGCSPEGCGCNSAGDCSDCSRPGPRGYMEATNWLADVATWRECPYIEVQFKNTRKGYYVNPAEVDVKIGDIVVVEASPGHDVGRVSMVGPLVQLQMKRANLRSDFEPKKIFRKARPADLERFENARAREHDTMIRSRKIAEELELDMKIGDVEYQGDGGKAIFYYIADERVDFRKLIRILADTFHVRIEMKQIGARQEAGRIGGLGPCGRPLCCATWMNKFASVGTSAARQQDLSMNPQKLAGQCAKLKCCINFEADTYAEAYRQLPHRDITLETADATYYFFKADILQRMVTYTTARNQAVNLVTIPASRAFEIIALNKNGVKVSELLPDENSAKPQKEFVELVGQDSLTRFDKSKKGKNKKRKGPNQQKKDAPRDNADQPQNKPKEGHDPAPQARNRSRRQRPPKQASDPQPEN